MISHYNICSIQCLPPLGFCPEQHQALRWIHCTDGTMAQRSRWWGRRQAVPRLDYLNLLLGCFVIYYPKWREMLDVLLTWWSELYDSTLSFHRVTGSEQEDLVFVHSNCVCVLCAWPSHVCWCILQIPARALLEQKLQAIIKAQKKGEVLKHLCWCFFLKLAPSTVVRSVEDVTSGRTVRWNAWQGGMWFW